MEDGRKHSLAHHEWMAGQTMTCVAHRMVVRLDTSPPKPAEWPEPVVPCLIHSCAFHARHVQRLGSA
eukprot:6256471-Alexandrium_andersonii.AAC.1